MQANLDKHLQLIEQARAQTTLCFRTVTHGYNQDLSYSVAAQPKPDNPIFKPYLGPAATICW
jgi:hypothetical protein